MISEVFDSTVLDTPRQRPHNFLSLILQCMQALMWAPVSPSFHGSSLCYVTVIGHWEYQEAEANGSQEEFQTVLATHTAAYTIPLHLETKEGLEQWVLPEDLGSIPSTHMAALLQFQGDLIPYSTVHKIKNKHKENLTKETIWKHSKPSRNNTD